jgi:hypothetical protein
MHVALSTELTYRVIFSVYFAGFFGNLSQHAHVKRRNPAWIPTEEKKERRN